MLRITEKMVLAACCSQGKEVYAAYVRETGRKTATVEQALEWLCKTKCPGIEEHPARELAFFFAQYSCGIAQKNFFRRHKKELIAFALAHPKDVQRFCYGSAYDLTKVLEV